MASLRSSSPDEKENTHHSLHTDQDPTEPLKFPTSSSPAASPSVRPDSKIASTDDTITSGPGDDSTTSSRLASASNRISADTSHAGPQEGSLKHKRSTVFHGSEAFKSKTNQKPFSRSAAKRESVMALGSIGHLQNFYAKQGFAARQPNARLGGRLALGPAALGSAPTETNATSHRKGNPADALAALEGRGPSQDPVLIEDLGEHDPLTDDEDVPLPAPVSTWKGKLPPDVPKPVEADLSRLWGGMIEALDDTCQVWDLFSQIKSTPLPKSRNPSATVNPTLAKQSATALESGSAPGIVSGADRNSLLLDANTQIDPPVDRLSRASLDSQNASAGLPSATDSPVDLLEMINGTTKTIRAVRNYLFALPPLPKLTSSRLLMSLGDDGQSRKSIDGLPAGDPSSSSTNPASTSSILRKKGSMQFTNEEHLPGVKARDAFKRQSAFQTPAKSGDRRRSFIGSSGFASDWAEPDKMNGEQHSSALSVGPKAGKPTRSSHAPSSFVPFETVQQRRRSSMALDDDEEREKLRRSLGLEGGDVTSSAAGLGKGLPSGVPSSVATVTAGDRASRGESPQRSAIVPVSSLTAAAAPPSPAQEDPLVVVRSSALEVLGMLRSLEESNRVAKQSALTVTQEGDHTVADSSSGFSIRPRPHLPSTVSVRMMRNYSEGGQDDDNDFGRADTSASGPGLQPGTPMRIPKEDADEEVEGYLYRQDVTLGSLAQQRDVVSKYLGIVDSVLASVGKVKELRKYMKGGDAVPRIDGVPSSHAMGGGSKLGLQEGRMTQSDGPGMQMSGLDEERLPAWARPSFTGDGLERTRCLLRDALPELPDEVITPSTSDGHLATTHFLVTLSDGQILCHAYNAALRRSGRPWGFIQSSAVHDVKGEEEVFRARVGADGEADEITSSRRPPGWTFRRIENLKRFSAAVALRYGVKTSQMRVPAYSRSSSSNYGAPTTIEFDAGRVAKMDEGWEDMLQNLVLKWVEVVVEEERGT